MSAADWVQSSLNALAKRKAKYTAPVLAGFQRRAVEIITHAMGTGVYNIPIKWETADWDCGSGVCFTMRSDGLATFDFDRLTRLVLTAHEECVRIELEPCARRYVRVFLHPRARSGGMSQRHPTIQEALTAFNGHQREAQSAATASEPCPSPKASDEGGWIEWKGGECPVGRGPVDIRYQSGDEQAAANPTFLRWEHWGSAKSPWPTDIVAYRLAPPTDQVGES